MEKKLNLMKSDLPNFDGGIVLVFPKTVQSSHIVDLFGKNTDIKTYDNMLEMTYTLPFCVIRCPAEQTIQTGL